MPGIFSGDQGAFTIQADMATDKAVKSEAQNAPTPKKTSEDVSTEFNEFRQWQAWKNARDTQSKDYQEFLQWLEFQKARGDSP